MTGDSTSPEPFDAADVRSSSRVVKKNSGAPGLCGTRSLRSVLKKREIFRTAGRRLISTLSLRNQNACRV